MGEHVIFVVVTILMFGSMFLTLIPALPSIPFMFILALGYTIADKFVHITFLNLVTLLFVTCLSLLVDYLSGIFYAKYGEEGRKALVYGFGGLIIGLIIAPPFGAVVGFLAGLLVSEITSYKEHHQAIAQSFSKTMGSTMSIMINFALAFVFIGLFATYAL
jgi:uncharacterized protein YqgC (DUF456 family)